MRRWRRRLLLGRWSILTFCRVSGRSWLIYKIETELQEPAGYRQRLQSPGARSCEKLLAWSSLARSPPPPSRRATGPTGCRQELEAGTRWRLLRLLRLLRLFWRRCFGNLRLGTTIGRIVRRPRSAAYRIGLAWCARHIGGWLDLAQQTTTDRRGRWCGPQRQQGILRRNRPIAALCRG